MPDKGSELGSTRCICRLWHVDGMRCPATPVLPAVRANVCQLICPAPLNPAAICLVPVCLSCLLTLGPYLVAIHRILVPVMNASEHRSETLWWWRSRALECAARSLSVWLAGWRAVVADASSAACCSVCCLTVKRPAARCSTQLCCCALRSGSPLRSV
jgi:hypothetical protein